MKMECLPVMSDAGLHCKMVAVPRPSFWCTTQVDCTSTTRPLATKSCTKLLSHQDNQMGAVVELQAQAITSSKAQGLTETEPTSSSVICQLSVDSTQCCGRQCSSNGRLEKCCCVQGQVQCSKHLKSGLLLMSEALGILLMIVR